MHMRLNQWIAWILVLIWMGFIFYLSHQPADKSSALSAGIVEQLLHIIEVITRTSLTDADWIHYLIRKGAHLFAYFLLAILLMYAHHQMEWNRMVQIGSSFVISVLYATSDEFHQLFIPGRSGQVTDIMIDAIGASIGIGVFLIIHTCVTHFRHKPSA